jgi:hypothetical protein
LKKILSFRKEEHFYVQKIIFVRRQPKTSTSHRLPEQPAAARFGGILGQTPLILMTGFTPQTWSRIFL